MSQLLSTVIPYGVLISHIILGGLILAFIFRKSWGKDIFEFVGKNSLTLAFLVSLIAVGGSLFYSEIIGFEPCVLCWWQRVFIFPLVIVFGVSLYKKFSNAWSYAVPMTLLAFIISFYQTYSNLGGGSILPCTAAGGSCSKLYVMEFGYITIPTMSLTITLYLITFYLFDKFYKSH